MLQYIPIDKSIAFGRPITHRGGKQMRTPHKGVVVFMVAVMVAVMAVAVVITGAWLLDMLWMDNNENFCAAINRTIDIPPIKKITDFLFRCS